MFYGLLANGLAQGALAVLSAWLVMRLFDQLAGPTGNSVVFFVGLGLALGLSLIHI